MTGNLIADFVKGPGQAYSQGIQQGIQLHRYIDQYTDGHPEVRAARQILHTHIRHYAGPVLDVLFDHFLGKNWGIFETTTALSTFSQNTYSLIEQQQHQLPPLFIKVYQRMKAQDWLTNYQYEDGILQSLYGLERRASAFHHAQTTFQVFLEEYNTLEHHFLKFYPELQRASLDFIQAQHLGSF